jgi:hypothetical protein
MRPQMVSRRTGQPLRTRSCPSSRGPITSAPAKLIHSPKLIHLMKEAGGISCCPVPSPCLLSWFHGVHLCPRSTLSPIAGVLIVEHSRIWPGTCPLDIDNSALASLPRTKGPTLRESPWPPTWVLRFQS